MPKPNVENWTDKTRHALRLYRLAPWLRKVVVCVVGGLLLSGGLILIVTPGPAFVFIPLGLLLLGSEFRWAKRSAQYVINFFPRIGERIRKGRRPEKRP